MLQLVVMDLLLLPLIITGPNADAQGFDIAFPCHDLVCYNIWSFRIRTTRENIVIISNGAIKEAAQSKEDTECTVHVQHLTEDDDKHYCKQAVDDFTAQKDAPAVNLVPGKMASFQCVLLSFLKRGFCDLRQKEVRLAWVDQAGVELQDDSRHGIRYKSSCHVTLTVTLQGPGRETFSCRAEVGDSFWISEELRVQLTATRGKGRGGFNVEGEPQDSRHYQVSVVVGVLASATLTTLAAVFVVRRRRMAHVSEASISCPSNNVEDDVVYADVILPASAERVSFCEDDATEYACIRYQ
ncbi:diverse immunoglobulin domain-containing protein 2.2 isoform X2 [Entelurus aequoreus]|uniref:diverse immunoglobulin domain-containing protein 2.2 isoform X2 n=1 Tax=Entelurus aequoreus TaxID=161455 RepID=UPI002B1E43AA|nr:diverse immunoglobulin domain-containing protein 2.2 isoform X2 [Entelurus aequoreus]